MAEIVTIDHEATSDLKRITEMLREDGSYKRQWLDEGAHLTTAPIPFQPSQVPNMSAPNTYRGTGANAIRPPPLGAASNSRFSHSTSGRKCFPPLTQTEIALLNKHKGCRKCRQFYVSHRGNACPNDFPDGSNYVPLSEDVTFKAMRKLAIASTYSGPPNDNPSFSRNAPALSHAQQPMSSSFSNAYNNFFAPPAIPYSTPAPSVADHTSAQIEELDTAFATTTAPVGAVLPSSFQPFVLLGGESDTSGSTEDISPISVPHLIWKGQIWNNDDVQIPYECLLDDGAHLVLIRPETVTDLGLPIRRLHKPVSVTLALSTSPLLVTELWDYVSLSLSSLNNAWSSKPVRALLAPSLCSNILLGLPFLAHNKIVIDHDSRTAIDKSCGFDLLNENSCRVAPPLSKTLSPKHKRLLILKHKKNLLIELKLKCAQRREHLDSNRLFEIIQPFNPIAAITERIHVLACQSKLNKLEQDIKNEYRDVFRPIPHISELPTSETARIRIFLIRNPVSGRNPRVSFFFKKPPLYFLFFSS
jgi:Aspartyl protease